MRACPEDVGCGPDCRRPEQEPAATRKACRDCGRYWCDARYPATPDLTPPRCDRRKAQRKAS